MNMSLSSIQSHVIDLCAGNELVKDVKFCCDLQFTIRCVPAGAQGLWWGIMVTVSFLACRLQVSPKPVCAVSLNCTFTLMKQNVAREAQ